MWVYSISKGIMRHGVSGQVFAGYSGAGHSLAEGRNNPAMQYMPNIGPIPVGDYAIGEPHDSPNTGPFTMNLDPLPGTDTRGRSAFRIHGNNEEDDASHGCVILNRPARKAVWESGDHVLRVIV